MTSTTTILHLSNPFPGLRCFLSEEDYLFFGRHEQIEDLLRRLRTNRLVAVVGTSGSGKSSLVRAGLLPAVLGGGMAQAGSAWEIAVMRPGGSPMAHLARALCEAGLYDADAEDALFHLQATLSRSRNGLLEAVRQSRAAAGSKLLLVVDQFEELFRFNRASATSQEEAIGFVNLLLHATQQADQNVYVVLTMRSDFLGECSQFLGLAEAVNNGEFLIPRMNRDQIQEAIEGPIRVRGAAIAPRLLFQLLNDVQDNQDQLPVLQHALMRTWDLWKGSRGNGVAALDLEHYEATGGMHEALSRHADEIFAAFPSDPHRTAAARIFKALTERGPDGRGIRRPTRLGRLVAIAAVAEPIVHQVIEAYRGPGVTFLMPPVTSALDDTTVIDISHESLMRVWRRLRDWVEEEAQSARIYRRLEESAVLHGEHRAGLYHDPDLQIGISWREASEPNSAWAGQYGGGFDEAMAFLDTSREAAERTEKEREAARQHELERALQLAEAQARVARLFKRFVAGLAAGLCLAVALTVWALMLRQEAELQAQEAKRQEATANEQRQVAQEKQEKAKALGLVQRVLNVSTPKVPAIIGEMTGHRHWSDPLLRERYEKAAEKSPQKLHASLALLPVDAGQINYLFGRLLEAGPQELPVIRDALAPHKDGLLDKLWAVVEKPEKGKESQRLRAAAALAKYDPDSETWANVQGAVGNDLVAVPAADLTTWKDWLRPVRVKLLAPLSVVYGSINRPAERSLATDILADYAADQPQALAELVMDADDKQFAIFLPKLKDRGEQGLPVLVGEINRTLPPEAKDEAKEKLAKRQANAAVALLRMNHPSKVWPLLQHSPDPRARSYLIDRLSPLGADAKAIVKQLAEEKEISARRALLLSLGEFGEKEFTPDERKALLPKLQEMYRTAADPGLHAASEWLLRQWKEEAWLKEINQAWAGDKPQQLKRLEEIMHELKQETSEEERRWYVNGQGQTLVVIPGPVEFMMGSPPTEKDRNGDEAQHWRRIGRSFAIGSKKVTVEQFLRFRKDHPVSREHAPSSDCPVNTVTWYEAAAYCNWLSEQEGIPQEQWCYEPNKDGKYDQGMKMAGNTLQRTGYRLPTEAEWEFSCRAGAATRYYFGESDELLPRYAWYQEKAQNKSWPVGNLKPNDLGLFDMHGNDWEWCQDAAKPYGAGGYGETTEDIEDRADITNSNERVFRGGGYGPASNVRSAYRLSGMPTNRLNDGGFRPVRTLPFSSFNRYAAARAAALAAAGQGKNEPPKGDAAKAKLRRQALDWLKAELTDRNKVQPRPVIVRSLWHWQRDTDLAGIRDKAALAKLPAEEQKAFTQWWAEVAKAPEPADDAERLAFAQVAYDHKDQAALDSLLKAHPAAGAGIGDLYAADKSWERAVAAYTKAITPETKDAKLLAKRAEAYEKLKQWGLAVDDWTRASQQQPDVAFQRFKPAGADSWQFLTMNGGAGSMEVVDGTLVFTTTVVTGTTWDVQFTQGRLQLENGAEYSIRFKMKSPDSCAVILVGAINQEDWHLIGLNETLVPPSEFRDYEFTFVPHDVVPGNNRIGFDLGMNRGKVMVKEIVILKKFEGNESILGPGVGAPRKLAIQGQTAQAAQAYAKALAAAPDQNSRTRILDELPQFHGVLTALHRLLPNDKQIEEAYRRMVEKTTAEFSRKLDPLTRAIQNQPNQAAGYLARGECYGRLGHWQKAADDYGAAYRLQADPFAGRNLGILLVWIGKADRYRVHCQELLDRLAGTSANHEAEWALKTCCLLGPGPAGDPARLARLAKVTVSGDPAQQYREWQLLAHGLYEYRAKRYDAAVTNCREARSKAKDADVNALTAAVFAVEAMALRRSGDAADARRSLAEGKKLIDEKLLVLVGGDLGEGWHDWLVAQLLNREAEGLIAGKKAEQPK